MKNLSTIDEFINEALQPGEDNIANGAGILTVKRTDDNQGFNIKINFQGSVHDGDIPNDAQEQLRKVANELGEILAEKLDWIN